jgi:methyl-accepting chemotaxis protein
MKQFNRMSLINQTVLPMAVVILTFFITFACVAYYYSKDALITQAEESLERDTNLIIEKLRFYDETLRNNADRLSSAFFSLLEGGIELDASRTMTIGQYESPLLILNSVPLNLDFSYPDEFTKLTGGTATIFVRYENDFLRATTSLRKSDGSRAIGTLLGQNHPGYIKLMNGEKYVGRAHLFGRYYMTVYSPIQDIAGETIAILYVGFDFTEGLKSLYKNLTKLHFGKNGGVLIFNTKKGAGFGKALVYHQLENIMLMDIKDADGIPVFSEIHENDSGSISFNWQDENTSVTREMIASYTEFKPWDIMVITEGYVDELASASTSIRNILIVTGILCSLVVLSLTILTLKKGLKPLRQISETIKKISNGDLQINIDTKNAENSKNEIVLLNSDINNLVNNLNKLIKQISFSTSSVESASENLTAIADKNFNNVEAQKRDADSLATAITEMVASSQEIANFAKHAATETQNVDQMISEGQEIVSHSASTAKILSTTIEKTAEMINLVDQDSNSISTVLDVIRDIAEQTNLLALNAAIEAARAGEQGRGFAVVADEVRTLAQRSQDSTHEIRSIIEKLQNGSKEAVKTMQHGLERSNESVAEATHASESLEAIGNSMSTLSGMTSEIANTTDNQKTVGEDINHNIVRISDIAYETNENGNLLLESIQELQQLSSDLQTEVNKFKVSA